MGRGPDTVFIGPSGRPGGGGGGRREEGRHRHEGQSSLCTLQHRNATAASGTRWSDGEVAFLPVHHVSCQVPLCAGQDPAWGDACGTGAG